MTLLMSTLWSFFRLYDALFIGIKYTGTYWHIALIPVVPFLICAPLIGWLVDNRFERYSMFKAGIFLTFLATVLACVCVLILKNISGHSTLAQVLSGGVSLLVYILAFVGLLACTLTAFQLGLDQMPDASSSNITSFVIWFIFSAGLGFWISDCLFVVLLYCVKDAAFAGDQLFSLFQVCCMSIICCSLFLFGKKWLIIEPKCSQSLKIIYQVLKFAAKHKAPLNRSAFTYWEEDVPSRLDLGKARYGGPFTTEQVEDVKTFFKILIVLLPLFVTYLIMTPDLLLRPTSITVPGLDNCTSGLVYSFSYSPWFWMMMMTLCSEFVFYPLFSKRLPSILTNIGIGTLFVLLVRIALLIVSAIKYVYPLNDITWHWPLIIYCAILGCISQLMLTKLFEFVCAQSPYNMRGVLTGYVGLLFFSAIGIGAVPFQLLQNGVLCFRSYCSITENGIAVALALIGLIVYCLLARWYKMRVRDEEYHPQQVIEEIYDRYLSHQ